MDELKALLSKYSSTDQLAQSGLTVAGMKYMYLSSSDKVVRAKKGTSGVHCIKTTQGAYFLPSYTIDEYCVEETNHHPLQPNLLCLGEVNEADYAASLLPYPSLQPESPEVLTVVSRIQFRPSLFQP